MRKPFLLVISLALGGLATTAAAKDYNDGASLEMCPGGSFLVGLNGRTGDWVDAIRPVCASWDPMRQIAGVPAGGRSFGGPGGGVSAATCPSGSAVSGWEERSRIAGRAMLLEYVAPQCRTLRAPHSIVEIGRLQFGRTGTQPEGGTKAVWRGCPDAQFITGIWIGEEGYTGRAGTYVKTVRFVCGPVTEHAKSLGRVPTGSLTTGVVPPRSVEPAQPPSSQPVLAPLAVVPNDVIYVLAANNDLLWYGHTGRTDGSFRWADPAGRRVGSGWNFRQVFSGGDGVIYAITFSGDLMWYRHDGRSDGTFRWAAPEGKMVASGWDFEQVFSGGDGVIYGVTFSGDLMWFRHDGRADGSARWAAQDGKKVGTVWGAKQVFYGGNGIIYGITGTGDLMWRRHDGHDDGSARWSAPEGKVVGTGWNVRKVFYGGDGIIYAITDRGDLLWNRHDGRRDGTPRWAAPSGKTVGKGWVVKAIFSGASDRPRRPAPGAEPAASPGDAPTPP